MADATLTLPIRSAASGTPRLILIECKDWKRPVGIGAIDALESKRRDLQVSVAMICSNSGFTEDALRKAARVRIPALTALIENDQRIRVEVLEEIFTRRIIIESSSCTWHPAHNTGGEIFPEGTKEGDLYYSGLRVAAWLHNKIARIVDASGTSRRAIVRWSFRHPLLFHANGRVTAPNHVGIGPLTIIKGIDLAPAESVPPLDSEIAHEEIVDDPAEPGG